MRDNLLILNRDQHISETDTFTLERYKLFTRYFPRDSGVVLDYGCNIGRGGEILREYNSACFLIGADILSERLEKIPDGVYNSLIDLSKNTLEESISKLDVIVSGEVVEHIPFDDLISTLKTFLKLMNPGGKIILTTPNPDSFLVKLGRDSVLKDPSHVNIMRSKFLKTVLEKIGFSDVVIKGCGKAVRFFGQNFPLSGVYGSYMVIAEKRK